jgi:DNA-binding transcriptional LysR family regulator
MADQSGLREFVAVVEHGSFTAAADALNVSTTPKATNHPGGQPTQ